jgi:hypothetical protein
MDDGRRQTTDGGWDDGQQLRQLLSAASGERAAGAG